MTGVLISGCPWKSLDNPIVARAIQLFSHYETGNLGAFLTERDPEIYWQALECYIRFSNTVKARQWDEQQEARKKAEIRVKDHGK